MIEGLVTELEYRFSRSSGPGGQNVNKVSTQVELLFDLFNSNLLNVDQKDRIATILNNRLTIGGIIFLKCNETRSQIKNKEIVTTRFINLITDALKPIKVRKPTKPTKSSNERRIANKKNLSKKKKNRKITD